MRRLLVVGCPVGTAHSRGHVRVETSAGARSWIEKLYPAKGFFCNSIQSVTGIILKNNCSRTQSVPYNLLHHIIRKDVVTKSVPICFAESFATYNSFVGNARPCWKMLQKHHCPSFRVAPAAAQPASPQGAACARTWCATALR